MIWLVGAPVQSGQIFLCEFEEATSKSITLETDRDRGDMIKLYHV